MFKSAVLGILLWLSAGTLVLAQSGPASVAPISQPVQEETSNALPEVLAARVSTTPERARL
ncbi:MAG: hypothetical protein JWR51_2267, partial [Devosia sp.]|uniref:hypothetical protein n=1 Tax=Devosia sp. TaxID=1871048 RepID=UPI002619086C